MLVTMCQTLVPVGQYPCPAGTCQDQQGQSSCKEADPGFTVSGTMSVTQTECPADQPTSGQVNCIQAEPGHYVATLAQPHKLCEVGTYQANWTDILC